MEFVFELLKLLFNLACLWAAWWAGKEGYFQNLNHWLCPHPDCEFKVRSTTSWVIDRVRDDHLMKFHS